MSISSIDGIFDDLMLVIAEEGINRTVNERGYFLHNTDDGMIFLRDNLSILVVTHNASNLQLVFSTKPNDEYVRVMRYGNKEVQQDYRYDGMFISQFDVFQIMTANDIDLGFVEDCARKYLKLLCIIQDKCEDSLRYENTISTVQKYVQMYNTQ